MVHCTETSFHCMPAPRSTNKLLWLLDVSVCGGLCANNVTGGVDFVWAGRVQGL